jgi:hypothetical protein
MASGTIGSANIHGDTSFTITGHVHIQIIKVPPLPPFPEAKVTDGKPPSPEHALAAYTAYVAYFGTYTIDPERRLVTHHVEGSLAPDFTDTHQPRPFKLEDATGWRSGMARLGGVCWNVCADLRTPAELRVGTRPSRWLATNRLIKRESK